MVRFTFNPSDYPRYYQASLDSRWLKLSDWNRAIAHLNLEEHGFTPQPIGHSVLNAPITSWQWGRGSTRVLIWSQMHGNEPTGTMALADVFAFLADNGTDYEEFKSSLAKQLTLAFIPILNPDGAATFQRFNAQGIDINRDAARKITPEMQAFQRFKHEFNPNWAFNLHDQRSIFSAGQAKHPATISFLAASSDFTRRVIPVREKAMQLIAEMLTPLEELLPEQIGRYSDEFYPRALGDQFHAEDIPCVLIESGADFNDPLRRHARKANFLALIQAFGSLAQQSWPQQSTKPYLNLPENQKLFYDMILRNVSFGENSNLPNCDVALMIEEKMDEEAQEFAAKYLVKEIGDLNYHFGLREEEDGEIVSDNTLKLDTPAHFRFKTVRNEVLEFKIGDLVSP